MGQAGALPFPAVARQRPCMPLLRHTGVIGESPIAKHDLPEVQPDGTCPLRILFRSLKGLKDSKKVGEACVCVCGW